MRRPIQAVEPHQQAGYGQDRRGEYRQTADAMSAFSILVGEMLPIIAE
jgi:hypothetical protein